jgi:HEAT repeat protein
VLAVLDAPTRHRIAEALPAELQVAEGRLQCRVDCDGLVRGVRRAVALAGRLTFPLDGVPARLAQNARQDPLVTVRLRNLGALLEHYPDHPEMRNTIRDLRDDTSSQVRLRAALALGTQGYATLAEIVADPRGKEEVALEAFNVLVSHLPVKKQWSVIDSALCHGSRRLRERAVRQVALLGGPHARGRLPRLLADSDPTVAVQAARAIETVGDASCESALVGALSAEDPHLRTAAADALGAVGTAAAVAPLEAALAGASLVSAGLRSAVHKAVERIQSRLSGAEAGQLSLAESPKADGRVSLVASEAGGEVTLAPKPVARGAPKTRPARRRRSAQ